MSYLLSTQLIIFLPDEGYLVWSNCNEAEGKHVIPFRPNVLVTLFSAIKKYFPTCNIIRPLIFLSTSVYFLVFIDDDCTNSKCLQWNGF